MFFARKLFWTVSFIAAAALLLAGCVSLAGDVTPPPNYRPPTPAPAQPTDQSALFPVVPPDPAQGAAIFAEKCQPCHGDRGLGDGPRASQLPKTPAAIGTLDLARKSRPVGWYQTVTDGNLSSYMPGFTQSLNDRQRWDVVAYVYTLSASSDVLASGKTVYDANCADCHGATGRGDGAQAASLKTKPASWIDQQKLAGLSLDEMSAETLAGKGEMPAYQGKLDDNQAFAVSAYIRSLSFAKANQQAAVDATAIATVDAVATKPSGAATKPSGAATKPSGAATKPTTPEGTAVPSGTAAAGVTLDPTSIAQGTPTGVISITGKVTNGTAGAKLPDGLKVTLSAFNQMTAAFDQTVDAAADGSYAFKDVAFNTNYVYIVRTQAYNMTFNSDILHGTDVKNSAAVMPLSIYETATDPAPLRTERLHVFFQFNKTGQVQVVNLYIISNPTDHVIISPEKGKPVIQFELPKDATNLQFQDGTLGDGRYIQTANGFGDAGAIQPGSGGINQVLFAYDLPYTNALDFNMKVPLPVDAATVMVPPGGVTLKSDKLLDVGKQDMQGISFQMYQEANPLAAGDHISLTLSGAPNSSTNGAATGTPSANTALLIGLGVFGLVLIGAGYYLYRARMAPPLAAKTAPAAPNAHPEETESSDSLLDAIIALDDQHAHGSLPEAAYQQRRAELKARLASVLKK